jgi:putative zinc finger protein
MNCNQAIELLPWLLNGTLEAGESDELRRHLETCESCRQALQETRDGWKIFSQHLPAEALVSLAYGERPVAVGSPLAERHLASCPQCAADLELAKMSRRLEEDEKIAVFPAARSRSDADSGFRKWRAAAMAAGLVGIVAASGWMYSAQHAASLSERLAQRPAPSAAGRPTEPMPSTIGGDASRQQIARLAGQVQEAERTQVRLQEELKQATGQLAELKSQPRGSSEPRINTWSGLVSAGDVVRGQSEEVTVEIPGNREATPFLEATGENTPRRIEIRDANGQLRWHASGLLRTDQDDYRLTIPAHFLEPGKYTIQLYGTDGESRERYTIQVR